MLKKIYQDAQFNPKYFGLFLNPFYFARKGLYKCISELTPSLKGRLLDIGCGTKPYKDLCNVNDYIGLEIDDGGNRNHSHADFFYDGNSIPFEDNYFDSILANQVFEHVFNPNRFLQELSRVTKIDGLLLLTVPFVWDEHEQPYDYARYSSYGLKHILNKNGFEIVEIKKTNNGIELIFQILNAYLFKITKTNNTPINLLITIVLLSPINILGLALSKILPKNEDLYLDNVVLAKKVNN
jgi:SAM-dependent methyltransferase